MNLEKLAPWNWFKKEEEQKEKEQEREIVPIKYKNGRTEFPASLRQLQNEFERLFNVLRQGFSLEWPPSTAMVKKEGLAPFFEMASNEKAYSVKVEIPGIDAGNISIEYSGDTLKIRGEKSQETEERDKDFYRVERSYGSFMRILDIPKDADADKITSSYKEGVLRITIPKKILPEQAAKEIEIAKEERS